jgi:hypothetical protein
MTEEQHWYDNYPAIARSLKLLKPLPDYVQELLGKQLHTYAKELSFSDTASATEADDPDGAKGLARLRQLMQNKSHHPLVGRALNEVMTLSEKGRNLIGQRMLLCLQALDNMSKGNPDGLTASHEHRIEVHSVIRAVFSEDIKEFEKRGKEKQEQRAAELAEEQAARALLAEAAKQMQDMDMAPPELEILETLEEITSAENGAKTVPLSTLFKPELKRVGRMLMLMLPNDFNNGPADPVLGEATFSEHLKARGELALSSLSEGLEDDGLDDAPVDALDLIHASMKGEEGGVELLDPHIDLTKRVMVEREGAVASPTEHDAQPLDASQSANDLLASALDVFNTKTLTEDAPPSSEETSNAVGPQRVDNMVEKEAGEDDDSIGDIVAQALTLDDESSEAQEALPTHQKAPVKVIQEKKKPPAKKKTVANVTKKTTAATVKKAAPKEKEESPKQKRGTPKTKATSKKAAASKTKSPSTPDTLKEAAASTPKASAKGKSTTVKKKKATKKADAE